MLEAVYDTVLVYFWEVNIEVHSKVAQTATLANLVFVFDFTYFNSTVISVENTVNKMVYFCIEILFYISFKQENSTI